MYKIFITIKLCHSFQIVRNRFEDQLIFRPSIFFQHQATSEQIQHRWRKSQWWWFLSWILCCHRRIYWRWRSRHRGGNAPRSKSNRKGWRRFLTSFMYIHDFFTLQVVLYNSNLTNLHNLTGDQIGAYFGYTIATCDINGDGLDDILIGAPMWTDFSLMGKFETGRVYVVYQSKDVSVFCLIRNWQCYGPDIATNNV